ncbi:MAG: type I-MYXAN CRISPR-associated protein Cas6/Cmx6 [Thermoanaerobaculia bacterium]|nr:type I-MYXAN CRISPR-associated protein Cas6/Cmx6 [Thermoanaerobaculia bacterium]
MRSKTADQADGPFVDLTFAISGRSVPIDHGYALYAAVSRAVPQLHGASWLGLHPIDGASMPPALLLNRRSRLRLRLPLERINAGLQLAGKDLDIDGNPLVVGVPAVRALEPARNLAARLVVVKLTSFPLSGSARVDEEAARKAVDAELRRQMAQLPVEGQLHVRKLREVRVAGRRVLGFAVRVEGLDPEDSVRLQSAGLGGKRRMGCGIFIPTR